MITSIRRQSQASLFIACMIMICVQGSTHSDDTEKNLIDALLSNYSPHSRPVANHSDAAIVEMSGRLVQIMSLDEKMQVIKLKLWLLLEWNNDFQKWDPREWGGIHTLEVPLQRVWVPDIMLYSGTGDNMVISTILKTDIILKHYGKSIWKSPITFESTCPIAITHFPFDRQYCTLKFGSWNNNLSRIDIHVAENKTSALTDDYVTNSEWIVEEANYKRYQTDYSGFAGQWVDIKLHLTLKRKPHFHMLNTVSPCLVLLTLLLLSFFLPPQSGERMGFVITLFLSTTVFQQLVSDSLPRNPDSFPRLSLLFTFAIAEGCLSLFIACIVIRMQVNSEQDDAKPVPTWLKTLSFFGTCTCRRVAVNINQGNSNDESLHQKSSTSDDNTPYPRNARAVNGRKSSFIEQNKDTTIGKQLEEIDIKIDSSCIACSPPRKQWRIAAVRIDNICFNTFLFGTLAILVGVLLPSYLQS